MRLTETQRRGIFKAISYRFFGTSLTAAIALALTGRFGLAAAFGLVDVFVKIGGYYFHERLWDRINYG